LLPRRLLTISPVLVPTRSCKLQVLVQTSFIVYTTFIL
jgi:hypothetical protein